MKKIKIPLILLLLGVLLLGWSYVPKSTQGELDVDILKTNTIMPAAHHVYANEEALDGKYYLFKSKITNNTNKVLEDVTVKYQVPGFIEWTEIEVIGEMKIGQTASVCCYPKFKEDICDKTTESMEKAEIEISWNGASEDDIVDEEFSFKISDRNEYKFTNIPAEEIMGWSDVHNNDALLACYVTPNDPIVKYYTQNIQEKILKGEQASVTGNPEEAIRFMAGIYNATLLSHMVYSGTKGIPTSITDVSQFSQHNRLPREVITGNTGLCLELSILYASILSNAGLDPIIYLVPGHAYPGFKLNNQYYAIEATGIGGEGIGSIQTAEQAIYKGREELQKFITQAQNGDPRYTIVDVHALNQLGVTPMALKDDNFLREKVDDIVESWYGIAGDNANYSKNSQGNSDYSTSTQSSRNNNNSLSFNCPQNWQTVMNPYYDIPILTAQSVAPDQITSVSVYDIPTNDPQEAIYTISDYLSMYNMAMNYQINGNTISGTTTSYEGNISWKGKILKTSNGIRVVAVGTSDYLMSQNASIINQIFNSIR